MDEAESLLLLSIALLVRDGPDLGRRPHIAVSTGMLRALEPAERRVLFAHDRSHLYHRHDRHDRHLLAGALAAAVNPS